MATTIRLTRMGKKKRPFYRLVVLDSRKRRDGAYLANLGYYNPFVEPHQVELHDDEIVNWLSKGATASTTAKSLLKREGILYRFSLVKQGLSAEDIEGKMAAWQEGSTVRIQRKEDDRVKHLKLISDAENDRRVEAAKIAEAEAAGSADESPATDEADDKTADADAGTEES